jgi:hypothetical protein
MKIRHVDRSEPHAFKAVVNLKMGKAHLDALPFIPRLMEVLCPHEPSRHIAGNPSGLQYTVGPARVFRY